MGCAGFILGFFSVVTYLYNFVVLVLWAPAFMINLCTLAPEVGPYFPFSVDFNPSVFEATTSAQDSLVLKIVIDVLLAALFVIPHSALARPAVKNALPFGAAYRPVQTLVYAATLHVLMVYWQPLIAPLNITFWDTTHTNPYPLLVGYLIGYLWLVSSTFAIDHFALFGIKDGTGYDLYAAVGIPTKGFVKRLHYRLVRHPIMTGFFIMFFVVPSMTFTHLFFSVACTAYILVSVHLLEEPDLLELHPEEYTDYMNSTPAYCPFAPVCCKKNDAARGYDPVTSQEVQE
eukprot:NODE_1715_length_1077_cov_322.849315.p1 GENE.NODE_1715_length_1077_cov_322.849315~~NODE_1715_length_1077_cov_322.849315.p1  ORF type:complete len:288 (+),score=72.69 NODE_1715_length_1077_cov_322.849315:125-988(+)